MLLRPRNYWRSHWKVLWDKDLVLKKFILFIAIIGILVSCEEETKQEPVNEVSEEPKDSLQVYSGGFVSGSESAILRGNGFVYSVKMDSTAKELSEIVAPMKSNDFQLIPVKVKGKVIPNPKVNREGWKEMLEIREIIETPEVDSLGQE